MHVLAAYLCLLELVAFVLGVLLFQRLHGWNDLLQGFVGLLGVVYDEGGVLLLLGAVIYRLTAAGLCSGKRNERRKCEKTQMWKVWKKNKTCAWHLTLHLDQFGHVCAEQRVNPLGLSVTIYIQLDVCREAAEKNEACMEWERAETKHRNVKLRRC